MSLAIDKRRDLSIAPFRELGDIGLWEPQHVGHHHLR